MGRQPKSANKHLRTLIEESGVSHKGLARRVIEMGASRGVRGLAYDHSSVARWLAGERPREPVPELIADVLAGLLQRHVSMTDIGMAPSTVAADVGLTLAATWAECVTEATMLWKADLERRRFLKESAVAMSVSSAAALHWLVSPSPGLPSGTGRRRIGGSDVDAIQHVVRSYREMDNRLGGGRVRGAVVHYLNSEVTPLLTEGRFNTETGSQLAAVGAELAQLAGWMAYDVGLHGHAQRYLTLALSFAQHAGSYGLGAEVLAAKAHQAVYLARPAEAVDLARAAQATARHAGDGDARACARALSDAEAAFGRTVRADDPVWLRYFDEAYLAARMGHCFRALGEPALAERYARRSLNMDGRFVRGKAFNLALLATALAEQDDVEQACAVGRQALGLTAGLRSARSIRYVRDLQFALRRRTDAAAVRAFNAQVAERLPAASAHTGRR